jgi:hypothetical protein
MPTGRVSPVNQEKTMFHPSPAGYEGAGSVSPCTLKPGAYVVVELSAEEIEVRALEAVDHFDEVGFIMAYEGGELDEEEIVFGFQHLINSGVVWQLQGHYGRTAAGLIEAGYCTPR